MECGKLTAKLRDAVPVCFMVDGKEVKPVGDGRYIVNNVKWKAGSNIQINATAETRGYSKFTFVVPMPGVANKIQKVYTGEMLTLPTLGEVGFKPPQGVVFGGWVIPGYGVYQPGETVKVTTTKEITVTATFEGVYHVIMEGGAKAYSDEAHAKSISAAKENDYIYIVAPEVEGKQFYMWDYELTSDTYRRPYFGDVTSPETDVMMPDSGIILTPLYTTAVTEVNIYGVIQPVAGEKFISVYDDFGNRSDGIRESDKLAFGYSSFASDFNASGISESSRKQLFDAMPYLFEDIRALSLFSGIGAFEKALGKVVDEANKDSQ